MKLAQKIALNYLRAKLNIIAVFSKKKAAKEALKIFSTPFRKSKKKTPPVFLKGEKISFKLEDNVIRGFRWNHPAKMKILIAHGFESSIKSFDRYIIPFIKRGYEVIAFDAPAHGRSDGKTVNLLMYIDTLKEIHERFGPIDAYLGHSFGGLAITHFLENIEHNPDIKVVLIAPATESTSAIDTFFKILDLNTDIRKEFEELIYHHAGVMPEHYSIRRAIQNIKAKVLWFHDEDDDLTPISDTVPIRDANHSHVEFVISKGLGHKKIYRENKVVKRIVEFFGNAE